MKIKTQLLIILFLFISFQLPKIELSGAYLSDDETTLVSMTAGIWDADSQSPPMLSTSRFVDGVNLDFYLQDKNTVGFKVFGSDVVSYDSLDYLITYDSDQTEQGIVGKRIINGESEIIEKDLLLGTCTSGGTCTFNTGVTKVKITVTLRGSTDTILNQEITL